MLPNIRPELNNLTESLALKGELQRAGINRPVINQPEALVIAYIKLIDYNGSGTGQP